MDIHPDELSKSDEALHFNVKLKGFHTNTPEDVDDIDLGKLNSHAVLDSGSTICLLPADQTERIQREFGVVAIDGLLTPYVDCAWGGEKGDGYSFDFKFEGKVIRVPLSEMVIDAFASWQDELMRDPEARRLFGDWESICIFGIGSTANFGFEGDGFTLLGATFLRSAYVVYDLANEQIGIAQAKFDSDETDLVDIEQGSSLPDVQGVQGQSSHHLDRTAVIRLSHPCTIANNSVGEEYFLDAAGYLSNPFGSGNSAATAIITLMALLMAVL